MADVVRPVGEPTAAEGPHASGSPEPVVRIVKVRQAFKDRTIINELSLDVREGEFLSFLGPSGCGKTTLLRIIAGLDYPSSGRVFLEGRDVTDVPAHKRPVNMVFQRVTLFPHLNVGENVAFGLKLKHVPKDEARKRVAQALELVRLPGFEDRDSATLSGGEAQRVSLARALVNRPRVLLLDEPLSALDLQIRQQLQVELKDIHRELGSTFIYVTHDQEEAMTMSDRILVMHEGEIVQMGSPTEIYRAPASVFVAGFVGKSNMWEATVLEPGVPRARVDLDGEQLWARAVADTVQGEHVLLLVRPECISLESPDGPASCDERSSLPGVVQDVQFLGSVVNYRVRAGGRMLRITHSSADRHLFHEGQDVVACWSIDDAVLLKD
jgi:spermidine/putrescine transport system ATP-binding protein